MPTKEYHINLIIPCYNEEESLDILYEALVSASAQLSQYNFLYLFINDGSKDGTLSKLKKLSLQDSRVKYISFSRNFGKEAAIYAGFCNVDNGYTAIMDADMQDPPSLLPEMVRILDSGEYDSVATRRISREGEPVIRSFFARMFYKIINRISDADIVDGARDFRLMTPDMVRAIISMDEYNRFSKGIFGWVGFKTYWLSYKNIERVAGKTKWNFWKLFKYSIDGIINFSQVPLSMASWSGIGITGIGFVMLVIIIIRKLLFGDPVAGWTSLVCIIMFLGGIQLLCLGVIGQYISKTYLEVKRRPHFIVNDTNKENCILLR